MGDRSALPPDTDGDGIVDRTSLPDANRDGVVDVLEPEEVGPGLIVAQVPESQSEPIW